MDANLFFDSFQFWPFLGSPRVCFTRVNLWNWTVRTMEILVNIIFPFSLCSLLFLPRRTEGHVTTRIFEIDWLPNFLRYGAPLARLRCLGAPLLNLLLEFPQSYKNSLIWVWQIHYNKFYVVKNLLYGGVNSPKRFSFTIISSKFQGKIPGSEVENIVVIIYTIFNHRRTVCLSSIFVMFHLA